MKNSITWTHLTEIFGINLDGIYSFLQWIIELNLVHNSIIRWQFVERENFNKLFRNLLGIYWPWISLSLLEATLKKKKQKSLKCVVYTLVFISNLKINY